MPNSPYASVALIAVLVLLMYFVVLRPQRKRQQQQAQALNAVQPGTRVMLTSGIFATVVAVGEKQMVVETSPGQRLTILKQAMSRAVPAGDEDAPELLNQNATTTNAAANADQGYGPDDSVDPTADPARADGYPTYTDVPVEQATSGGTVWPPEAAGRAYPDSTSDLSGDSARESTWSAGTSASDQAAGNRPEQQAADDRSDQPDRTRTPDNQSNRD